MNTDANKQINRIVILDENPKTNKGREGIYIDYSMYIEAKVLYQEAMASLRNIFSRVVCKLGVNWHIKRALRMLRKCHKRDVKLWKSTVIGYCKFLDAVRDEYTPNIPKWDISVERIESRYTLTIAADGTLFTYNTGYDDSDVFTVDILDNYRESRRDVESLLTSESNSAMILWHAILVTTEQYITSIMKSQHIFPLPKKEDQND